MDLDEQEGQGSQQARAAEGGKKPQHVRGVRRWRSWIVSQAAIHSHDSAGINTSQRTERCGGTSNSNFEEQDRSGKAESARLAHVLRRPLPRQTFAARSSWRGKPICGQQKGRGKAGRSGRMASSLTLLSGLDHGPTRKLCRFALRASRVSLPRSLAAPLRWLPFTFRCPQLSTESLQACTLPRLPPCQRVQSTRMRRSQASKSLLQSASRPLSVTQTPKLMA